jgi:O-antigen/teichoic acid export membrane protein
MRTSQRIIKNSFFLLSSQIVSKLINLILIVLLTRLLGKNGFGVYSFTFAYVGLFIFMIHLGMNSLLVREIAKDKNEAGILIGVSFPIVLICSLLTFILLNTISFFVDWTADERIIIFIFGFYLIFDTIGRYFIAIIRAHERMEFEAFINVSERVFLFIATLLAFLFHFDLKSLVILFAFVQFLKLVGSFFLVRKFFIRFNIKWSMEKAKSILRDAYPFALIGIFGTITTRIDLVLIKVFHSSDVVGIYNISRKVMESLSFIPENIYFAVFPTLSFLFIKDREKFKLTFQRMLLFLILIAIPIVSGIFIFAQDLINLLFRNEFSRAYLPLQWLAIALGAYFIKHAFAVTLNAVGKQYLFSIFTGLGMLLNIFLNLILIPTYEIIGASIATLISEIFLVIICIFATVRYVNFNLIRQKIIQICFAGILLTLFLYIVRSWNLVLIIMISSIVYSALLFVGRIISWRDIKELLNLISIRFSST